MSSGKVESVDERLFVAPYRGKIQDWYNDGEKE